MAMKKKRATNVAQGQSFHRVWLSALLAAALVLLLGTLSARTASAMAEIGDATGESPYGDAADTAETAPAAANGGASLLGAATPARRHPDYDGKDLLEYLAQTYPPTRSQDVDGVHYGTCWAHAAVALGEFYMIRNGLSDINGAVDNAVDYSETQLMNFCYRQAPSPYGGGGGDTVWLDESAGKQRKIGNFGGNFDYPAQSLMRQNGLMAGVGDAANSKTAYVQGNGLSERYATSMDVAHLKSHYIVNIHENPDLAKRLIRDFGAVGIRYYENKKYLNAADGIPAYYNYVNTTINHCVAIVGWDDDFPATAFKKAAPGNGAWLVRNSHSTDTALDLDSYFWISYHDTSIEDAAHAYEMADMDSGEWYEHLYCHDGQTHGVKRLLADKAANVYSVVADSETLRAVQIDSSTAVLGKYRVCVYVNVQGAADPTNGEPVASASGEISVAGRFTVKLDAPVRLVKGQKFSIVVASEGGVDREMDKLWKSQLHMDVTMHEGESFAFSNGKWRDLAKDTADGKYGNLCIRALTNTEEEDEDAEDEDAEGETLAGEHMAGKRHAEISVDANDSEGVVISWTGLGGEGCEIWRQANGDAPVMVGVSDGGARYEDRGAPCGVILSYALLPLGEGDASLDDALAEISVKRPAPAPSDVSVSEDALFLTVGDSASLSASVLPKEAPQAIAWSSSKPSIATVDSKGRVAAVKAGKAVIYARAWNGVAAGCMVTVHAEKQLYANASKAIAPAKFRGGDVQWATSDKGVATVAKGVVTGVNSGVCTVTGTRDGEVVDAYKVRVLGRWVYKCLKGGACRYAQTPSVVKQLKAEGWKCTKAFRLPAKSKAAIYCAYDRQTNARRYTADRQTALQWKADKKTVKAVFYASEEDGNRIYEVRKKSNGIWQYRYVTAENFLNLQETGWALTTQKSSKKRLTEKDLSKEAYAWLAEP